MTTKIDRLKQILTVKSPEEAYVALVDAILDDIGSAVRDETALVATLHHYQHDKAALLAACAALKGEAAPAATKTAGASETSKAPEEKQGKK